MSTLGSIFPLEELQAQGDSSRGAAWPGGGRCGQGATALTLLMWSFLVPVVQRRGLASSLGLGIFSMVSCLWRVEVDLLRRGIVLGTYLCCYLGDIT